MSRKTEIGLTEGTLKKQCFFPVPAFEHTKEGHAAGSFLQQLDKPVSCLAKSFDQALNSLVEEEELLVWFLLTSGDQERMGCT